MASLVVYGIPSCGTVKKARAWLEARGAAHTFIDFRTAPVSPSVVRGWVKAFGVNAMKNTSGGAYRELGEAKDTWSDDVWTEHFIANAMLIKRPVIERDGAPILVGFRGSDDALKQALLSA